MLCDNQCRYLPAGKEGHTGKAKGDTSGKMECGNVGMVCRKVEAEDSGVGQLLL